MIAQTEFPSAGRPLLVLASADSRFAAASGRHFRRLGWEVHLASCGGEARRLARSFAPAAVVIDTELRDESGWLSCDKLTRELPGQRVILVGPSPSPEDQRRAVFVGATALVPRDRGPAALADEVAGTFLPAVG
jgi:ActR/RegA family two-component response regulator